MEPEADAASQVKMLRQHPLGASALVSFGESFANALIFFDVRVCSILSHALVLQPRVTDNRVTIRRIYHGGDSIKENYISFHEIAFSILIIFYYIVETNYKIN